jgi:hypothetical protein
MIVLLECMGVLGDSGLLSDPGHRNLHEQG